MRANRHGNIEKDRWPSDGACVVSQRGEVGEQPVSPAYQLVLRTCLMYSLVLL